MKSTLRLIASKTTEYLLEASNLPRKYQYETELLYRHNFLWDRLQQITIMNQWREHFSRAQKPLSLQDVCFKVFSGNGQDGILLYLLTVLKIKNYTIVDIGCGNGVYGNSANLIINHGFHALLIDADKSTLARGSHFYSRLPLLFNNPPVFVEAFLTPGNINSIISNALFEQEVDVLSIDIDLTDLYILEAISCVLPRIIVLEFNNAWGPKDCKSVPYRDGFTREWIDGMLYGGASLAAFSKVLKQKGYWLIGCDSSGFDAYFIREGHDVFPEISVQDCYEKSRVWKATNARLSQSKLNQKAWVDI
ncbi:MAG TPA: hypothetical protein VIQ31_29220 [Phormidium sp.]